MYPPTEVEVDRAQRESLEISSDVLRLALSDLCIEAGPIVGPDAEATMRTGAHKDRGGVTIERFSDRLATYLENQSAVESLRDSDMPQFPWPDANNPMLEYLVHRSEEMAESDGRPASVVWLAVHAWFEGALRALAVVAPHTEACPTPDSSWFDNLRSNERVE